MSDECFYDVIDANLPASWVETKLADEDLVVPEVSTLEHLVNLLGCLLCLKALLYHVWRELQLAESNEVSSNKVEDLVISNLVFELENILD